MSWGTTCLFSAILNCLGKKKSRVERIEDAVETENLKLSRNRNVTTKAHTDSYVMGPFSLLVNKTE